MVNQEPGQEPVGLAGGLLWRRTERGAELALVSTWKNKRWSLPKGRLDPGESFQAAAVREVMEETGCRVRLGSYAGSVEYPGRGQSRNAMFWNMLMAGESGLPRSAEIADLAWMTVEEALEKLEDEGERRLLRSVAEKKWPRKYRRDVSP